MRLAVVGLGEAAPHPTLDVVTADGVDPCSHARTLRRIADRSVSVADGLWITSDAMPDDAMRDDYAELLRRRALTEDAARPDAVERRHAAGGRTARENVDDLVDPGSFVEY